MVVKYLLKILETLIGFTDELIFSLPKNIECISSSFLILQFVLATSLISLNVNFGIYETSLNLFM